MITHASSNVPSRLIGPPIDIRPLTIEVRVVPSVWVMRSDMSFGQWVATSANESMPYFLVKEELEQLWPQYQVVWVEQSSVRWEDA